MHGNDQACIYKTWVSFLMRPVSFKSLQSFFGYAVIESVGNQCEVDSIELSDALELSAADFSTVTVIQRC